MYRQHPHCTCSLHGRVSRAPLKYAVPHSLFCAFADGSVRIALRRGTLPPSTLWEDSCVAEKFFSSLFPQQCVVLSLELSH